MIPTALTPPVPANVVAADDRIKFVDVKRELIVVVLAAENVMLYHEIPFVFSVHDAAIDKVDVPAATVPAVYVHVPP